MKQSATAQQKHKKQFVVIGRFTPIGEAKPSAHSSYKYRELKRNSVLLLPDGEPICRTVKLERIGKRGRVS